MINKTTIYFLFLLLPGIVSTTIFYWIIDPWKKQKEYEKFIKAFFVSVVLYSLLQVFFPRFNFLNKMFNENELLTTSNIYNLLVVSLIGTLLSIFFAVIDKKNYIYKVLSLFKITKVISSNSVFQDIQNLNLMPNTWVTLHIFNENRYFIGYISKYCVYNDDLELFLKDVDVCSTESGELIYSVKALYLKQKYSNIFIEYD